MRVFGVVPGLERGEGEPERRVEAQLLEQLEEFCEVLDLFVLAAGVVPGDHRRFH